MQKTKIMIVESRQIIREGVKHILESALDIAVTAEASSVGEAYDLLKNGYCHVILMGNTDQWADELASIQRLKTRCPKLHIILLMIEIGQEIYDNPLAKYADCCLTMNVDGTKLANIIRGLAKCTVAQEPMKISRRQSERRLSARERQVLSMITEGKTVTQIAGLLQVSYKTVSTYRQRALLKLGCENDAQMMLYASQSGLAV